MKNKIKINDMVQVIYGKDKGKISKVIKIINNEFVYLKGLKMVTKHIKNTKNNFKKSIIKIESKIHISNVKLFKNN